MNNYLYGKLVDLKTSQFIDYRNEKYILSNSEGILEKQFVELLVKINDESVQVIEVRVLSEALFVHKFNLLQTLLFDNKVTPVQKIIKYLSLDFERYLIINDIPNNLKEFEILYRLQDLVIDSKLDDILTLLDATIYLEMIEDIAKSTPLKDVIAEPFILYLDLNYPFELSFALNRYLEYKENSMLYYAALIYHQIELYIISHGSTVIDKSRVNKLITEIASDESELEKINVSLSYLYENKYIVQIEDKLISIKVFDDATKFIANSLYHFVAASYTHVNYDNMIKEFEKEANITFAVKQKEAIVNSLSSNFQIITGGPGTGKTTVIKAICHLYYSQYNEMPLLLAPTGRAAKRIAELVDVEAYTIHKVLRFQKEKNKFLVNEENPLSFTAVIIDEFSMVDLLLFYQLLSALPKLSKLIIVGDSNQLPSVNPGNNLKELLEVYKNNTTTLDYIYRQSQGSKIQALADKVNKRLQITDEDINNEDIIAIETKDINSVITEIYYQHKETYHDKNMIVLASQYSYIGGINSLNSSIQLRVNDSSFEYRLYRVDDPVIQLKNMPSNDLYNGDLGVVKYIDFHNQQVSIEFNERTYIYNDYDLSLIALSYAISIHKSQGAEFDIVILSISPKHASMYSKKLLYTALSRAKKKLYIVGDIDLFCSAIKREDLSLRRSMLVRYLNVLYQS